jgi:hypothetical protein
MSKKAGKKIESSATTETKPIPMTTLDVTHAVDVKGFLLQAIDKYGAKRVLKVLGFMCFHEGMPHAIFPMSLLANEKDEETIKVALVVKLVLDNWDSMSKRALKHWEKYMKDVSATKTTRE